MLGGNAPVKTAAAAGSDFVAEDESEVAPV